ncbi:MAG: 30S ribosomal protein S3 [Sedimentisphaerales bacterium]|nr:30S ribosomal protein S3 [Sedimentisphaerales bacterium]
MGQKTSPIGFRTGVTLGWQSTWFAPKANYGEFLVEDQKIRKYVDKKFNRSVPNGAVAKVQIIRTRNEVKVTLYSARPGVVIGPRGGEVDKFREELEGLTGRKISVNVIEIKEPDLNASLVAEAIAEQLGKRASFRRTMKQFCENAMNAGAKGVKIVCSGRLAGSEMARKEMQKLGSIPLHTLDADVDYATATARTTYGAIGIKTWIYKGKFGEENDQAIPHQRRRQSKRVSAGPRGRDRSKFEGAESRNAEKAESQRPVENNETDNNQVS